MEMDYLQETVQMIARAPTNRLAVNPTHLKASINEMIDIREKTEGHLHLQ
jgi:hypothetical protein